MASEGYGGGETMPLGGYGVILSSYLAGLGTFLALARGRLPARTSWRDLMLVGVATHKLTRTITRDWVTAPLRAPFTRFAGSSSVTGEVREAARGQGLRRAIGDLITCTVCSGPWVAGVLAGGLVAAPRVTRFLAGVFSSVAVSDFLHQAYEAAHAKRGALEADRSIEEHRVDVQKPHPMVTPA